MALLSGFQQDMGQTGSGPQGRVRGHAPLLSDLVCGFKANAANIPGQTVRISGQGGYGIDAIGFIDAHRTGGAEAVLIQKHHDLSNHLLIMPSLGDQAGAMRSHPRTFAKGQGFVPSPRTPCPQKCSPASEHKPALFL